MKKLRKREMVVEDTVEAFACSCGCHCGGCTCNGDIDVYYDANVDDLRYDVSYENKQESLMDVE
ncbi:CLI_3235 family bacteriocin precursor [Lutispora saccharofermentans]|uniref:CLI_3235 family bacteriocin n=1 Tax=Lutispora saccharofermentans TaxID=3024236 RepID=A0ABT1NIZ4_9FIRM|nr:CLI_3235 family bacteriocin precursor [Lutispora saccharofermentans]MCQ1531248.1 CLI_3235 family bacteriocin precursor [Lutispora saccharofermentans]